MGNRREKSGTDTVFDDKVVVKPDKPKLEPPPMYKVVLLNDDYTPMEFVVHVLERFFGMHTEKATMITLTVHMTGSAVVGIYPREIAETKSEQVNEYSHSQNYPLLSKIEMTD